MVSFRGPRETVRLLGAYYFGVPEKAFFRETHRLLRAIRESPLRIEKPFLGCIISG